MFKQYEKEAAGFTLELDQALEKLSYNDAGLIPAIAQQHDTGEVLMMAWMNLEALHETISTGRACYWSRSRGQLWRKGESSNQTQHIISIHIDCDGDTLLLKVDQTGAACHTGRRDCFFWKVEEDKLILDNDPIVDPSTLYSSKLPG